MSWNTDDLEHRFETGTRPAESFTPTIDTAPTPEAAQVKKRRSSRALSKGQVSHVLDTFDRLASASTASLNVLREVMRLPDGTPRDLALQVLTGDLSDSPLAVLGELLTALGENQFKVPAILAGMDRNRRARAYAVLHAVTGQTKALSSKDVDAAMQFTLELSELSDLERRLLTEAAELIG